MKKRDPTTAKFFNCDIAVWREEDEVFELNGHLLDNQTLAKLTGAFDGCYLLPVLKEDGPNKTVVLEIEIAHDDMLDLMQRTIIQGLNGFELVSNDIFVLKEGYRGQALGIRSFAIEAFEAQRLGISRIETKAAGKVGDPVFSGWYIWARAGFQAELTQHERRLLAQEHLPALNAACTLHDLMRIPEGVEWWKEHGQGRLMEFDLAANSPHWSILTAYLGEKGVVL